jgi:hypothetical protein
MLAVFHMTRLVAGLRLPDLPYTVPAWYFPFTGGLWAAIALAAAFGLYRGSSWAPILTRWASLGYAVWYWTDRLQVGQTDYTRRTWPFALGVTILSLVAIFLLLNLRSIKHFYREDLDE